VWYQFVDAHGDFSRRTRGFRITIRDECRDIDDFCNELFARHSRVMPSGYAVSNRSMLIAWSHPRRLFSRFKVPCCYIRIRICE
jgi:hypothetical protein